MCLCAIGILLAFARNEPETAATLGPPRGRPHPPAHPGCVTDHGTTGGGRRRGTAGHVEPAQPRRRCEGYESRRGGDRHRHRRGLETRLVPARGYELDLIERVPLPAGRRRTSLLFPARAQSSPPVPGRSCRFGRPMYWWDSVDSSRCPRTWPPAAEFRSSFTRPMPKPGWPTRSGGASPLRG